MSEAGGIGKNGHFWGKRPVCWGFGLKWGLLGTPKRRLGVPNAVWESTYAVWESPNTVWASPDAVWESTYGVWESTSAVWESQTRSGRQHAPSGRHQTSSGSQPAASGSPERRLGVTKLRPGVHEKLPWVARRAARGAGVRALAAKLRGGFPPENSCRKFLGPGRGAPRIAPSVTEQVGSTRWVVVTNKPMALG